MAGASGTAAGSAVRRLRHELESLRRSQVPQIAVQPSEDDLLVWHFVLHSLPQDTPYHGGQYHGKILFPAQYPLAPPSILMVTPSGRLEVGKRLCLSMTDFHPESWNPAWSVETILVGLLSFFISDTEKGYGAITSTEAKRKEMAVQSHTANARDMDFRALFPELLAATPDGSSTEEGSLRAIPAVAPVEAEEAAPAQAAEEVADTADPDTPTPPLAVETEAGAPERPPPSTEAPSDLEEGRTVAVVDDDDEGAVCWICRDETDEPLIQPCACRGSMSGVHASCVEDWIRHHRRNAVNDEPPKCSVCNQPYRGQELRPGVGTFLRQKCWQCARQVLRTLVLVVLVCGYQAASDEKDWGIPIYFRVVIITIFSVVALHKLAMLTVSLPLHRAPPHHPFLRYFFVSDYSKLSMHIAEAFVTVMVLNFQWAMGLLPFSYFAPFGIAGLIPVGKLCLRHGPSVGCLLGWAQAIFLFICFPLVIVGYPLVWAVRHPRSAAARLCQSLNPLGPGPQIYVAIAGLVLCWACQSNIAPVVLWLSHAAFALLGLLELFLVQKLPWQRSYLSPMVWVLSLQLSALTAYFANTLCVFKEGWGSPDDKLSIVHATSCSWLVIISCLTLKVNWASIMERYRLWQRRHGTFTLQVPATSGQDSRAPLREAEERRQAPPV